MTFNPSIPLSTDLLSASQQPIEDNFTQLNTQFAVDHVAFNTGSANGNGHHKQVTFDAPPTPPSPTGTISAIYPKAVSAIQQLFFKNASTDYQLTGLTISTSGSNRGLTTPWGIVINWGSANVGGGGPTSGTSITFAVPFPSSADSCIATGANNNATHANVTVQNLSTSGVTLYSANNNTVYYFAIGR